MEVRVDVYGNRMELVTDGRTVTVSPSVPYVGRRVLVGSFEPAVDCLERGLAEIGAAGRLARKPALVMQAMEMNAGGLSEVESRCLQEVALAAGARSVKVE